MIQIVRLSVQKTSKLAWPTPTLEERDVEENTEAGGFILADGGGLGS